MPGTEASSSAKLQSDIVFSLIIHLLVQTIRKWENDGHAKLTVINPLNKNILTLHVCIGYSGAYSKSESRSQRGGKINDMGDEWSIAQSSQQSKIFYSLRVPEVPTLNKSKGIGYSLFKTVREALGQESDLDSTNYNKRPEVDEFNDAILSVALTYKKLEDAVLEYVEQSKRIIPEPPYHLSFLDKGNHLIAYLLDKSSGSECSLQYIVNREVQWRMAMGWLVSNIKWISAVVEAFMIRKDLISYQ